MQPIAQRNLHEAYQDSRIEPGDKAIYAVFRGRQVRVLFMPPYTPGDCEPINTTVNGLKHDFPEASAEDCKRVRWMSDTLEASPRPKKIHKPDRFQMPEWMLMGREPPKWWIWEHDRRKEEAKKLFEGVRIEKLIGVTPEVRKPDIIVDEFDEACAADPDMKGF